MAVFGRIRGGEETGRVGGFDSPLPLALVSRIRDPLTKPCDAREDFIGGVGPYGRFWMLIVGTEVGHNRVFELAGAAMGAAAGVPRREQPEPAFHENRPRRTGGGRV